MSMDVIGFKSLWEFHGCWDGVLDRVVESGFRGVEGVPPATEAERQRFRRDLDGHELGLIAQVVTQGPEHFESFRRQVEVAAALNPVLITAQSAADSMSIDEASGFFEQALELEQSLGIKVAHETHRGRALFTPWSTAALLNRFPELRICADISHWVVVCERLLDLQSPEMRLALGRTIHIHGRVGFEEAPQVGDPRDPTYASQTSWFIRCWLQVLECARQNGVAQMTFTPEFGPAPYMPLLPYTGAPVVDVWNVNEWMFQTFQREASEAFQRPVVEAA